MFHERGAEAAGSHEETWRIAVNIAKLPELVRKRQLVDFSARYFRHEN
jgi:hypothetical protein